MAKREQRRAADGDSVRVLSVPLGAPVVVRFLGPVQGLLLHWHGGRSVPCQGQGDCPATIHRSRTLWRGYGPVEGWDEPWRLWRPAVLEVTEGLEEYLRGRTLRGEVWQLVRDGALGKRAPVEGVFCEALDDGKVSPWFDPLPVLQRFYHTTAISLGALNPLPPRTTLPAVGGAAPNLPEAIRPAPAEQVSSQRQRRIRDMVEEQERERRRGQTGEPSSNGQHS